MNKKSFFGGLAIGLAGILAVGAVGWFTKGFREWKKEKPVIDNPIEDSTTSGEAGAYDENGNNLADGNVHDMPMKLTFTGVKTLASNTSNDVTTNEDGTKEVTVQATLNRDIEMLFDWSVEWEAFHSDKTNALNINEYVTVTPASDGSATATVKLLQRFLYEITLKCTSREIAGLYATTALNCGPSSKAINRTLSKLKVDENAALFFLSYNASWKDSEVPFASFLTAGSVFTFSCFAPEFSGFSYAKGITVPSVSVVSASSSSLFSSYQVKVRFFDLAETDGYGFNDLYVSDAATTASSGKYYDTFTLSEETIKNAFFYDTEKGFTTEDYYTYGVPLLKGDINSCLLEIEYVFTYREAYGKGVTESVKGYCPLDISSLEGVDIDINGGENILF